MQITTLEYRWKGYDPCDWMEMDTVKYNDIDFRNISLRINKNIILHLYDEKLIEDYDKWYMWRRLSAT